MAVIADRRRQWLTKKEQKIENYWRFFGLVFVYSLSASSQPSGQRPPPPLLMKLDETPATRSTTLVYRQQKGIMVSRVHGEAPYSRGRERSAVRRDGVWAVLYIGRTQLNESGTLCTADSFTLIG